MNKPRNKIEKKKWTIISKDKKKLEFYPMFEITPDGKVEAQTVLIKEGKNKYTLNYLDLLMFCYFIGNEEQRMSLLDIQSKKIVEIPFDVTFKISKQERIKGVAKRRVVLPVDELVVSLARAEAQKSMFLKKLKS